MNTVLDDNKEPCLIGGEAMAPSGARVRVVEPEALAVAPPPTVSWSGDDLHGTDQSTHAPTVA
jgi:hypothetical protein